MGKIFVNFRIHCFFVVFFFVFVVEFEFTQVTWSSLGWRALLPLSSCLLLFQPFILWHLVWCMRTVSLTLELSMTLTRHWLATNLAYGPGLSFFPLLSVCVHFFFVVVFFVPWTSSLSSLICGGNVNVLHIYVVQG